MLLLALSLVTVLSFPNIETKNASEYASPAPTSIIGDGGFTLADSVTDGTATVKDSIWGQDITPSTVETLTEYVSHAPISISGDTAFTTANGVTGGKGTLAEPFIIEGWDIVAATTHGISIQNTNAYFIIRNVRVHSSGSNYNGLFLGSANNGAVLDVEVTGNYRGVFVWMSNRVTVWGGNATSNTREGISILSSSYTTVAGWNASGNGRDGIRVFSSSLVTIAGNAVSSNLGGGISLYDSYNVTLAVNNVTVNNQFAVALSLSADNLIYHNNFAGVGILAFDDLANVNSWDAAYPSGGNYWSNYNGTDTNGDGIGDTSYTIDPELQVQDRNPLMSLYHDNVQPTWGSGAQVVASQTSASSVTLTWTQATDNVMVLGYRIYEGGTLKATLPSTMQSFTVTGLTPGTTYTFKVEAGDEIGNWSIEGPAVTVSTLSVGGGGGGGRFFLL